MFDEFSIAPVLPLCDSAHCSQTSDYVCGMSVTCSIRDRKQNYIKLRFRRYLSLWFLLFFCGHVQISGGFLLLCLIKADGMNVFQLCCKSQIFLYLLYFHFRISGCAEFERKFLYKGFVETFYKNVTSCKQLSLKGEFH